MNSLDRSQTVHEPDSTADGTRSNPPALPMLTYRGGKYLPTRQRMLASLPSQDALARLNQDADNDWSIALLHAWSIVTDVLGFYQERITNEGYIRTATERRSVLALARALGYDWRPGLAANVDLALTVAPDDQDQPQRISVEKGSAIQSTPAEGKLPQIFETSAPTEVRTEWNLLYPYVGLNATEAGASEPFFTNITSLRVANYRTDLQKDDLILLVGQIDQNHSEQKTQSMQPAWVLGTLTEVIADPQKPYTIIRWTVEDYDGTEIKQPALFVFRQRAALFGYAKGAVYFDGEETPPPKNPEGTAGGGQTNGPGTPEAPTTGSVPPTTVQQVPSNTSSRPTIDPPAGEGTTGGSSLDGAANTGDTTAGEDKPTTNESPAPPKVANWTPRTLSLPNLDINTFVANPKVPPQGVIFAGTKRDLFRSLDHGQSWQAVGVDPVGRNVTALTLDADGNLFAGSSTGGLYLSYDNGDNWTPVSGDSVAPAVKVTKDAKGETFKVDPPEILPKAPILYLEFGKNQAGKDVLYALAGKDLFVSENAGKTWSTPIEPGNELPATQQRLSAAEQRTVMVDAAKALLTATRLQWLATVITPMAQGAGLTKWFGMDLWGFLLAMVNKAPVGANAVRALAVSTQGKKSTVVVGTDAGKFTLKEKTRRWLVATVIVLLVLFQQFLFNHDKLGSPSVELAVTGDMVVRPTVDTGKVVTPTTKLFSQGTLSFAPDASISSEGKYTLTLRGSDILPAHVDKKKKTLIATGQLPLIGSFTDSLQVTRAVTLSAFTTFTATMAPDTDITDTIFAVTTTEAVSVNLTLTTIARLSPPEGIWPPVLTLSGTEIAGAFTPTAALPADLRFPWLNAIWQQVSDLLQTTVIAGWNMVKSFLVELWTALPDWLKTLLSPISEYVIGPLIRFVDTYLIQPLLNYTAATLLDISYITLGVLALLLAWIYADHKMSNRKTVRLEGPVNALVIHSNGQVFAGTQQGVFRSLTDDPNAAWWTKAARLLIRYAFPDVPMEPINQGLTTVDPASQKELTPDIRSLSFTNTGALLAGTAKGRIYRLSDPTAELDPNVAAEPNAQPDSNPKPLIKWECYDQGLVTEAEGSFTSTLKGVRTIATTALGQFVAGGVGADKVEDRWFTAQVRELKTPDQKKVKSCEIDLDRVYPDLKLGTWLVLRQPTAQKNTQGTPKMQYARYQVIDVFPARSQDSVTVGEFTRAVVHEDEQLVPAEKRLTTFLRTQTEVLFHSAAIELFDNRPVEGNWLYLKGDVPGFTEGQRLIVTGKRKRVLILEKMEQALKADNGLEARTLAQGDILQVVPAPKAVKNSMQGAQCDPSVTSCPWRLQTRDGFVGTVQATSTQIRWIYPGETDPEVSEVAIVRSAQTINLPAEATLQVGLDYTYDRVMITKVTLQQELAHVYDRATVTIFGNVVSATHGQTVKEEVLGSGSGMQANERFMLKERPLTYVSAVNDQGYASEITVKVNDIEWQQARYLYGLTRDRRAYIVRQDALDNTYITFGDDKQGARLPTGTEQVTATYRIGIGPDGNVPAYTIDQAQTLPSAMRRVTNPLPASGGVGADTTEDVRQRTPLSVRIMDRIVALADYEDYVRLYAGIGRVQLMRFGVGPSLLLHFTVADANGGRLEREDPLLTNLRQSIDERRAMATPRIEIESYEQLFFDMVTKVLIYPEHKGRAAEIEQTIRQKLLKAFSFAERAFGQDVAQSEVVALLQAVPGVAAVESMQWKYANEEKLYEPQPDQPLRAALARNENGELLPAQLLLLNPGIKGMVVKIATTTEPTNVLNEHEVPV